MGKRLALSLFVFVVLVLAAEGLASLVLAWRDVEPRGIAEQSHCEYDPLLGWVNKKGFHVPDLYGPGRSLTTNERGFRSTKPVTNDIPPGKHRMVFLGDSFTLGYGVDDAETYPAWLEQLDPEVETVNMGQGGYGVDQAILWYLRDGVQLDADDVFLVFIAPDFDRITESRFQGQYAKPCLRIVDDGLVLLEDPLPDEWGAASRGPGAFLDELAIADVLRRLRRRGEPLAKTSRELAYREVAERLLVDLQQGVRNRRPATHPDAPSPRVPATLRLVMIPLQDRAAGNPEALMAWLRPYARSLRVPVVDLTGAFDELSPGVRAAYYAEDGHLNPLGNRFVAERLEDLFGPHEELND